MGILELPKRLGVRVESCLTRLVSISIQRDLKIRIICCNFCTMLLNQFFQLWNTLHPFYRIGGTLLNQSFLFNHWRLSTFHWLKLVKIQIKPRL